MQRAEAEARATLAANGWAQERSAYGQLFSSRMIPGGSPEELRWLTELQQVSASPENAVRVMEAFSRIDVRGPVPEGDRANARAAQPG